LTNFNNFADLQKAILAKAKQVMDTKGAGIVKNKESEAVKDRVLDSYTPVVDQRRTTGGLDDVTNMHHKVTEGSNSITLSVTNDTPTLYDRDYTLNQAIIEGGDYYEYPTTNRDSSRYTYLNGRDYITETIEKLKEDGELVNMLKKELGGK
jgi:hypothetical protein